MNELLDSRGLQEEVRVRGVLNKISESRNGVIVGRLGMDLIEKGTMQRSVLFMGRSDIMSTLEQHQRVVLTGTYEAKRTKGPNWLPEEPYLNVTDVEVHDNEGMWTTYDIEQSSEMEGEMAENVFTKDNLTGQRIVSVKDFIGELVQHAYQQGFKLVAEHSKDAPYISLRCHLYNANSPFHSKCQFRICLQSHNYGKEDQFYTVSNAALEHSHDLDPLMFAHMLVDGETQKLMRVLYQTGGGTAQIQRFLSESKGILLSGFQIRSIVKQEVRDDNVAESDELKNFMRDKGIVECLEHREGETVYRRAVASFTHEELKNLARFGDFVSIDPSFCALSTYWTMIPITLVGKSRELRSGGCIFCSSATTEVFEWSIQLLLHKLPCKDVIRTICSDDDQTLDAAWERLQDSDAHALCVDRIICVWHKMAKFKDVLNHSVPDKIAREHLMDLFHKMAFTRSEQACDEALAELKGYSTPIRDFIERSFEHRLKTSTKAYTKKIWSLGYLSSVLSESANSHIKRFLGPGRISLVELRKVITLSSEVLEKNRQYIKGRKLRKALHPELPSIAQEFRVCPRIAEAILGSKEKSKRLNITRRGTVWHVTDPVSDFTATVSDSLECDCGKMTTEGLPCSHMFAVAAEMGVNIKEKVASRWVNDDEMDDVQAQYVDESIQLEMRVANIHDGDTRRMYLEVTAKIAGLAQLASAKVENFELAMQALDELERKLLGIPTVIDANATRPGRPRIRRIRHQPPREKKCLICGQKHTLERCPHLAEIRQTAPPIALAGKRSCQVCRQNGHYASTCPLVKQWRNNTRPENSQDSQHTTTAN